MPLELHDNSATLSGVVTIDDVEPLVAWLRQTRRPRVNLRGCNHLHTAALQAILAFKPKVAAAPTDAFLAAWVLPLLKWASARQPDKEADRHDHSDARR